MNFNLTPEQDMIEDSVQKFLDRSYPFEKRRKWADSLLGFGAENWQTFADLGWLALPFTEENGGFGGSCVDVMILQEKFGAALVAEPYVPNVVLCGGLIERAGTAAQKDQFLPRLISGESQFAFAHLETDAGGNLNYVSCQAKPDADNFVISGEKVMALNGHVADTFVVSARQTGDVRDANGISLFLIDADLPGLTVTGIETIDGLRAANVSFDNVVVSADMQMGENGSQAIEVVNDQAILAVGAEAVGMMKALYETTLTYVKERKQFNTPIGNFQVIQHRLVEMLIAYEDCKSALLLATFTPANDKIAAQRAASALKVKTAEAGSKIAEQAIQLHGAMGTTDELSVGYYYKRLLMIEQLFGTTTYHLDRFSRLGG